MRSVLARDDEVSAVVMAVGSKEVHGGERLPDATKPGRINSNPDWPPVSNLYAMCTLPMLVLQA